MSMCTNVRHQSKRMYDQRDFVGSHSARNHADEAEARLHRSHSQVSRESRVLGTSDPRSSTSLSLSLSLSLTLPHTRLASVQKSSRPACVYSRADCSLRCTSLSPQSWGRGAGGEVVACASPLRSRPPFPARDDARERERETEGGTNALPLCLPRNVSLGSREREQERREEKGKSL